MRISNTHCSFGGIIRDGSDENEISATNPLSSDDTDDVKLRCRRQYSYRSKTYTLRVRKG